MKNRVQTKPNLSICIRIFKNNLTMCLKNKTDTMIIKKLLRKIRKKDYLLIILEVNMLIDFLYHLFSFFDFCIVIFIFCR